ncbi:hypothetical protein NC652_022020 [Populus alba x Populus x berolinensis]|uniref:Uncharacterized protein n=1 Tax=Populus alba TaxID=43335 RepID=A0ACC4BVX7_POPAL|nr:hypothetical protein NC652_022020 [Populus alba x Populus x berolinensis]
MNSSGMAVSMVAACVAVLIMASAAAAHEGHVHTPGMEMAPPAAAPSSGTLASPSMVIGIALAFVASLVAVGERV